MTSDGGAHSIVLLVDRHGRVLIQERDEHAPRAPLQWGCVGGSIEPGETAEQAAYRELEEETGVRLTDGLSLHRVDDYLWPGRERPDRYHIYCGATDLTDGDIDVREGKQIVFVPADDILALDLAPSAAYFLSDFLASDRFHELRDRHREEW